MKKIFLIAMSAALVLVACDKDNYNYSGLKEGYGLLSFADAGFVVSEETNTRATEPASDNTVIWVYNVNEDGSVNVDEPVDLDPIKDVTYTTYGAVKTSGITLPGGNYVLRAQTKDAIPMVGAGDAAVYGIDQPFSITAGQPTELETLTLYLYKQVKVSVSYNEAFQKSLTENGGTTTVTLDSENFATFNVTPNDFDSDSQYLYIDITNKAKEVQDAGVSMEISVVAEMYVKEDGVTSAKPQKMTAVVTGVKPRDYRKIQIHKEEIKDGGANFSIVVDGLKVDTELSTDISASEGSLGNDPNAPKGDGGIKLINIAGLGTTTTPTQAEWNNSFTEDEMDDETDDLTEEEIAAGITKRPAKIVITRDMTQLQFKAVVPSKILDFKVLIMSETIVPLLGMLKINDPELDLIKDVVDVKAIAEIIPFPYHAPSEDMYVKGETELDFVLDEALPILTGDTFFKETDTTTKSLTHTFQMFVRDDNGSTKTIDLALEVMNPNYIAE